MKKIKIILYFILENRRFTRFLQACDVFEDYKVLGEEHELRLTAHCEPEQIGELMQKVMDGFIQVQTDELRVVLAHFEGYEDEQGFRYPNTSVQCYLARGVRVISNGRRWWTVSEIVKDYVPRPLWPPDLTA